ncbi:MAG: hypothetical protein U9R15_03170 [Chloroflexota bacterium]|nr:hypothetical protein [Chloroflexota bacterium]
MLQAGVTLTVEEVQALVFRLPPLEFIWLADRMTERAETFEMMCLADTGFAEWNEPGEDVYDHLALSAVAQVEAELAQNIGGGFCGRVLPNPISPSETR